MEKMQVLIIFVDGELFEVSSDPVDTEKLVKHLISQGKTVSCVSKWVTIRRNVYAE